MDWWTKRSQGVQPSPSRKRLATKKIHTTIPNAEIIGPEDDPERYVIYTDRILGQGAFGAVYRGLDMKTNTDVVIKKFKTNTALGLSPEESYLQEVNCLSYIREDCVRLGLICFIDHFEFHNEPSTEYYIVTHLLEGYITLDELLEDKYILTKEIADKIKDKIEKAVNALHKKGIRHGDLHQGNIMIDPRTISGSDGDVEVRLIDFGLCLFPEEGKGLFSKAKEYFKYFMIIMEKQSLDNLFFTIDNKVKNKSPEEKRSPSRKSPKKKSSSRSK